MDIQKIKELALANGFKLKEQASGNLDLNAYVYDFANAIEREVKAQAVPEGFVLVPKEPNREFKDRLRSYLDNLWMGDHGCDWDYFVDATAIKPNEIWRFMIEAQEPAND